MIIKKNTQNTVVVTLDEYQTIASPDWLFEFINESTGKVKVCSAVDLSNYPARYNKFIITESTSENLNAGEITLSPPGQYRYNIYEVPSNSPVNLNTSLGNVCETGICVVVDESENPIVLFDKDDVKNTPAFDA